MKNIVYIISVLFLTFTAYSFADTVTKIDNKTVKVDKSETIAISLSQAEIDALMKRYIELENAENYYKSEKNSLKQKVADLKVHIDKVGINWTGVNWQDMQALRSGINWTQF